ncbi:class I SAM-dependent methyltransferase [Paenibacillus hemerocallicola]|uniref:Class I SAM-dependent methyltransferase n=1 Tax=Paenibacillus hemerocallicola TaxID=1172614 RepID=A0A5C4T8Q6_9BACL|nr:class I SAM-dependent methyltransferase [Paenibacillus hemerocallicola]TNJ65473.1 class I SAM-dependent methyltransferase [Paenibacillus hemerocallicola]
MRHGKDKRESKGERRLNEWGHLTEASKSRWEDNAGYWDDYMGEMSNRWHRELIRPATERLLSVQEGQMVLDIACGNGNFSRRLVELGANVVAFDYSPTMIERAERRSQAYADRIEFKVADATSRDDWERLAAEGPFDGAVSNMALMDIADIAPLVQALRQCLKPHGTFVFSIPHPCFRPPGARQAYETEDREGEVVSRSVVHIAQYATPGSYEAIGIQGQPVPHYMFHRSLSSYIRLFGSSGFVLDGMEEPTFRKDEGGGLGKFEWDEIPPVLVMRFKRDACATTD